MGSCSGRACVLIHHVTVVWPHVDALGAVYVQQNVARFEHVGVRAVSLLLSILGGNSVHSGTHWLFLFHM